MGREESVLVTFIEEIEEPAVSSGNPKDEKFGPFKKRNQVFLPEEVAEGFLSLGKNTLKKRKWAILLEKKHLKRL